ncbi:MAG TPA: PaaI family thioesterase [Verrucomicrobiota bacterium]|nr:PaaI family thioesterase [Verrucomicrobiota bacterium]HNT13285.1 PaaI family thioesterase [Verrucomicrobiota bacterium]
MKELPHTHSCFVCGDRNPHGLQLRFHTDGQEVTTRFRPSSAHVGFKGVVHGGLAATVLDEIMVWACVVATRRFAYCAELTVRYLQPLQPDQEVWVTAALTANRKGRLFEAAAAIKDQAGDVLVTATGKYVPIPAAALAGMEADLVGDRGMMAFL